MGMGAFAAVVFNLTFASTLGSATPWFGLLAGAVVGLLFSLLHGVATITLRADHIISGTVINLMAPALGVFLIKVLYGKGQTVPISQDYYTSPSFVINIWILGTSSLPRLLAAWLKAIVVAVLSGT